jgi:hypothetical protein
MQPFSQAKSVASFAAPTLKPMMRAPKRICATVSWQLAQRLEERADYEGRSVSNLVSFLLEKSM